MLIDVGNGHWFGHYSVVTVKIEATNLFKIDHFESNGSGHSGIEYVVRNANILFISNVKQLFARQISEKSL